MKQTFNPWLGLLLLAGVAWLHYRDIPDKLGETPYLGWMYILLVAGCAAAGFWLLSSQWRSGYGLGLIISVGAIVAYSLTRTTGLPRARGDLGNWAEPSPESSPCCSKRRSRFWHSGNCAAPGSIRLLTLRSSSDKSS
ncbi:hypothetical protein [Deinococcus aquatilis]|uniref:hypothetical protein n=1 Tax=Deinococcus aquatilis TaxID=519440 RepID=UPI0003713F63|nr:hypothetical protein [Deinococcus aquatilis]